MYISGIAEKAAFERLKAPRQEGKSFQEKTSSLMYFLAVDALLKASNSDIIDVPPDSMARTNLSVQFSRLVLLHKKNNVLQQVVELGLVNQGGKDPEKRISSNFYTVPLKRAVSEPDESPYPKRPAPLLLIGNVYPGISWGIKLHPLWKENISSFLEMVGTTPFTDLAVFVCRNDDFPNDIKDWMEALICLLKKRFTQDLTTFWIERIQKEKIFAKHLDNNTFFSLKKELSDLSIGEDRKSELRGMEKSALVERVLYLEEILDNHNIRF